MLVLQITIFGTMLVGLIVRKLGIVGVEARKDLTNLVINIVLPCNIITSFITRLSTDLLRECVTIFLVSVGVQAFSVIYGKVLYRKESPGRSMNLRYGIICSNAGFLGNPIAEGLYGATGLMLASIYLIPQRIMMWSEGIAIYSGISDKKETAKKVISHPCVLACIVGLILLLTQADIPEVILTPIQTIGHCNTALSMMVIGMILAEISIKEIVDKAVILYSLQRLVIIPLIIYVVLTIIPVSHLVRGLSVILAAMPAGATTSMLASKYDRDPVFATKLVVFSTLCSIPAIIIWSAVLI